MTPEQKDYVKTVAIATLSGGLGGGLIGQFASEPPTMGKTLMGVLLGAATVGIGYGFYLRSGGSDATFAGLYPRRPPRLKVGSRSYANPLGYTAYRRTAPRFAGIPRVAGNDCFEIEV